MGIPQIFSAIGENDKVRSFFVAEIEDIKFEYDNEKEFAITRFKTKDLDLSNKIIIHFSGIGYVPIGFDFKSKSIEWFKENIKKHFSVGKITDKFINVRVKIMLSMIESHEKEIFQKEKINMNSLKSSCIYFAKEWDKYSTNEMLANLPF